MRLLKSCFVSAVILASQSGYAIVNDMDCTNKEKTIDIYYLFDNGVIKINGDRFTTSKDGSHREDLGYQRYTEESGLNDVPKIDVSLDALTENYRIVTTRAHYDGEMVRTFPKGTITMKSIDDTKFKPGKGYTLSDDRKTLNVEVECTWERGMLDD